MGLGHSVNIVQDIHRFRRSLLYPAPLFEIQTLVVGVFPLASSARQLIPWVVVAFDVSTRYYQSGRWVGFHNCWLA